MKMTSNNSKQLPIASTRLRSLILKKHLSTLYTQMTQENKADPQLTKMILFNIFQIFQINKINFQQYLILHNHPDTFIHKCDATTQTDYTTIRPKAFSKNLSNRTRTPLEKEQWVSYWPWDDNDSTDDELQKDPPEAILDENSPHKTYTYIAFWSSPKITSDTALAYSPSSTVWTHWLPPINTEEIAVAAEIQHHSALKTQISACRPKIAAFLQLVPSSTQQIQKSRPMRWQYEQ